MGKIFSHILYMGKSIYKITYGPIPIDIRRIILKEQPARGTVDI